MNYTKPGLPGWKRYKEDCICSDCDEERDYRESQALKPGAVNYTTVGEPFKPKRVEILETGAKLTSGDRDASYGDPSVNLKCAMELKQVYDKYAVTADGPKHGPAHHEAIHMALSKFGRIATGAFKEDNYVDGATYTAIAGEMAGLRQK